LLNARGQRWFLIQQGAHGGQLGGVPVAIHGEVSGSSGDT
jgi:hypothetical protein